MVAKEQVWKGLRFELSKEEICKIYQAEEYEKDDYYDFNLLIDGIHKAINKEIDFDYFLDWCVLIANAYNYTKDSGKSKLGDWYASVGYLFDSISFMDGYNKKMLYMYIASLKHDNYKIECIKNKTRKPFLTNGVERIMCMDHGSQAKNVDCYACVHRVVVIDYVNKEFDYKYVDDGFFTYDENINYTFVSDKKFANVIHKFYKEGEHWVENHNLKF